MHWIEESSSIEWQLKGALIRFLKINNAQNGEWLSQALFKVIWQVGIQNKVSDKP